MPRYEVRNGLRAMTMPLGVRWTIGDISSFGVAALRLSVWGAFRCFGPAARYTISVHDVVLARAQATTGALPECVRWQEIDSTRLPRWLAGMDVAPRAAFRFAPVLVHDDVAELALDRGCVLWSVPDGIRAWLDDPNPRACVITEDVNGPSSAIRGTGAGFDLVEALREARRESPRPLRTQEDAQRLELHALGLLEPPHVVGAREVARMGDAPVMLGSDGVRLSFPETPVARERWERVRAELHARLGLPQPQPARSSVRPSA
jgi:hypothetical protein